MNLNILASKTWPYTVCGILIIWSIINFTLNHKQPDTPFQLLKRIIYCVMGGIGTGGYGVLLIASGFLPGFILLLVSILLLAVSVYYFQKIRFILTNGGRNGRE